MVAIGYFLGSYIPGIDRHIEIVVAIVVFISLLPGLAIGVDHRPISSLGYHNDIHMLEHPCQVESGLL